MTLITFSDGKVVLRDGKVGTEQACCCRQCMIFFASPPTFGFEQGGFATPCSLAVLHKVVERLEAAGWTAELDESLIVIDGVELIKGIIKASCECCFACDDWVPIVTDRNENGHLTDQPEGRWCNIGDFDPHALPGDPCFLNGNPIQGAVQPVFYFRGCGLPEPYGPVFNEDMALSYIAGQPLIEGQIEFGQGGLWGDQFDIWVPCCNQENCDGNPLP